MRYTYSSEKLIKDSWQKTPSFYSCGREFSAKSLSLARSSKLMGLFTSNEHLVTHYYPLAHLVSRKVGKPRQNNLCSSTPDSMNNVQDLGLANDLKTLTIQRIITATEWKLSGRFSAGLRRLFNLNTPHTFLLLSTS